MMNIVVICTCTVSRAPGHNDAQDDRRERRKLTGMEYRSREWRWEFFYFACTFCTLRTRQSWARDDPALEEGALSRNPFCTASAPSAPSAPFSVVSAGFWRREGCGILRFVIMMSVPGSLDCRAFRGGHEEGGPVFFQEFQCDQRHPSREERAESI